MARGPILRRVSSFHAFWGYFSVVTNGLVGLWGLFLSRRGEPSRIFFIGVWFAIAAMLLQVLVGVIVASGGIDPGEQHVFYGVITAVTFVFAYIYRAQFRRRPALGYGLLLLFTMGLGIRGIMTFGHNF